MTETLFMPEGVPEGLSALPAAELHRALTGPTLLCLPGRRHRPLFTSVLQHGNETVGWEAVRKLLAEYAGRKLPRDWMIFIGNVAAARDGMRRRDGQPDFNRSWPGAAAADTAVHRMLVEVTDIVRRHDPAASVDVHNNTGRNPHYAVINAFRAETLNLAALFGRTALHFTIPSGVQSAAFEAFCPAVTVECGMVGNVAGVEHAARYLDACLNLQRLPDHPPGPGELEIYEATARLTVPANVTFGFNEPHTELNLAPGLDALNFRALPAGTRLGRTAGFAESPVRAHDLAGRDVTRRYLAVENGELVTARGIVPSMLTQDRLVIRQDCPGYLMIPSGSLTTHANALP